MPLLVAAENGHSDILQLLIAHGATVSSQVQYIRMCVHVCVIHVHVHVHVVHVHVHCTYWHNGVCVLDTLRG